jgi:FAD/FMN-containing dehydrogenase
MFMNPSSIERDLKSAIAGDVLCDEDSRNAYSTAACIYKIRPIAVVVPRTVEDVQTAVKYAYDNQVPVIPRGGASGLAGQAVGFGIILDCAKYMNKIVEVNPQNDWIRVEPGVLLDDLNRRLSSDRKLLPPDPASSDQCVIGGMIGTNAAGVHGLKHGATKDAVHSLTVVLSDGEAVELNSSPGTKAASRQDDSHQVTKRLKGTLEKLLLNKRELIQRHYPKVRKNSSGYNLLDAVGPDRVDLRKILVGSEGTLGVVVSAKLRIADIPKAKASGLAYFRDHELMTEAVLASLELRPVAVELMDKTLLDLARGRNEMVERFIEEGSQAILLFEFEGQTSDESEGRLEELRKLLVEKRRLAFKFRENPENLGSLWEMRKAATHILEEVQSAAKKASFIEDVTVPIEAFPEYIRKLAVILHSHEIPYSIYGHAGVGNIHCEPLLDLHKPEHRALLDVVASEVFDLAISVGGTLSGEHGDGYVRTPFLERLYGREVYSLFRSVKEVFDPKGILNPGKIVGPQGTTIAHDLKSD